MYYIQCTDVMLDVTFMMNRHDEESTPNSSTLSLIIRESVPPAGGSSLICKGPVWMQVFIPNEQELT